MNFVFAVVIGLVVGGVVGFLLRGKDASALWLAPVLAVAGAVVASVLATLFGDPGYGWKEATAAGRARHRRRRRGLGPRQPEGHHDHHDRDVVTATAPPSTGPAAAFPTPATTGPVAVGRAEPRQGPAPAH